MMQCKTKSENLAHILGYQFWAVTATGRIFSWSPPMNSAASMLRAQAIPSSLANMLGENKACVTLCGKGGEAQAGPATVLFFSAVCFTFLTALFSRLGAMGGRRRAELAVRGKEEEDEVRLGGDLGFL